MLVGLDGAEDMGGTLCQLTPQGIQREDLDRNQIRGIDEDLGDAAEFLEYSIAVPSQDLNPPAQLPSLPEMTTTLFLFSAASLAVLKEDVTEPMPTLLNPHPQFSTNDALCALLWHRISFARSGSYKYLSSSTKAYMKYD